MKAWIKGALIGGIWGILGTPIYILTVIRAPTTMVVNALSFITYFPAKLFAILLPVGEPSPPEFLIFYLIFLLILNFFGWAIIGAFLGHTYDSFKKRKSKQ